MKLQNSGGSTKLTLALTKVYELLSRWGYQMAIVLFAATLLDDMLKTKCMGLISVILFSYFLLFLLTRAFAKKETSEDVAALTVFFWLTIIFACAWEARYTLVPYGIFGWCTLAVSTGISVFIDIRGNFKDPKRKRFMNSGLFWANVMTSILFGMVILQCIRYWGTEGVSAVLFLSLLIGYTSHHPRSGISEQDKFNFYLSLIVVAANTAFRSWNHPVSIIWDILLVLAFIVCVYFIFTRLLDPAMKKMDERKAEKAIGERYKELEIDMRVMRPGDWNWVLEYLRLSKENSFPVDMDALDQATLASVLVSLVSVPEENKRKIVWEDSHIKRAARLIEEALQRDGDEARMNLARCNFQELKDLYGKHTGYPPLIALFKNKKVLEEIIDSLK